MIMSSTPKDPKLVSVYVRVGFLLLWTLKTPVSPFIGGGMAKAGVGFNLGQDFINIF